MTDSGGPSEEHPFRLKVSATGIGLVVDFSEDQEVWYAEGWDAARVAEYLSEAASVWRLEQVAFGGVDSLDEEQVTALEAGGLFFTLLALMEGGEYVPMEVLTDAIARVSRAANGVVLEESWSAQDQT